jgi:hypothetical protein
MMFGIIAYQQVMGKKPKTFAEAAIYKYETQDFSSKAMKMIGSLSDFQSLNSDIFC